MDRPLRDGDIVSISSNPDLRPGIREALSGTPAHEVVVTSQREKSQLLVALLPAEAPDEEVADLFDPDSIRDESEEFHECIPNHLFYPPICPL